MGPWTPGRPRLRYERRLPVHTAAGIAFEDPLFTNEYTAYDAADSSRERNCSMRRGGLGHENRPKTATNKTAFGSRRKRCARVGAGPGGRA